MNSAIIFDSVGKQYRLGLVGTGSLQHDINRWWQTAILRREDPYLKIGEVNDRSTKGHSDYVWALKDISFKVEQGDVVGIIGKNGAGKSTLLKLLSHITAPTTGRISYRGRIASLLEVGTGFHPEMTARQNIYMNGSIMGMTRHEITHKLDEIVDFAGIERYLDTPVKRFSSGMTVRLGFAVAAFLEPEILVVDEVLAVGDAEFQKKAIGKMKDVSSVGGRTVLFVSHNMASIKALCNKGVLLENGMLRYQGNVEDTVNKYLKNQIDKGEDCKITDLFQIYNNDISLYDFSVNGNSYNIINLEYPERTLNIEIKGHFKGKAIMDIETYLYTEDEVLLAKKKPSQYDGKTIAVNNCDFQINDTIKFPRGLANGTYYLKWDITHPKVECFAATSNYVKLIVAGGYTPQGIPLDSKGVSGYGCLSLDFD